MRGLEENIIIGILLCFILIQASYSSAENSATFDELCHFGQGIKLIKYQDFFTESLLYHPPLCFYLSSLPLFFLDFKSALFSEFNCWNTGEHLLYGSGYYADFLLLLARLPIIALSLLLAFFVYIWTRKLYGSKAGLFALFLYSFDPNMLAHAGLITTDLGAACFIFIAVYYFWKFIETPTAVNLVFVGITFGLAQLSKFTALYLIPIYVILGIIVQYYRKELFISKTKYSSKITLLLYVLILFIIGLLVINIGYGFEGSLSRLGEHHRSNFFSSIGKYFGWFPVPLPRPYIMGLDQVVAHSESGHPAFLMGNYSISGWWYYFIVAFILKTPIPMLIFLLLSIAGFTRIKHEKILNEYFIAIPALLLFLLSTLNHINIGLRHILPVYPFLFVFVSKIVNVKIEKQQVFNALFILLSLWYVVSSVSICPHYLSYFNEFVGPENGYKYLVDSNLDWGQDLKGLWRYMIAKNITKIKLSYFGNSRPDYYGIDYAYIPAPLSAAKITSDWIPFCAPMDGIIAISATELQGVYFTKEYRACYYWLMNYEPIKKIGYSIFVYNITLSKKDYINFHLTLGNIYLERGLFDEALEEMKQVLNSDPLNAEAHNKIGVIYLHNGDYYLAREEFKKALELEPNNKLYQSDLDKLGNLKLEK